MKMQASETSRKWMYSFMDGCHEMACEYLKPYFEKMFENCHLALLEFAEKAQSNQSQIRFMEAGTIIRENRKLIEQTFFEELATSFSNFKKLTRPDRDQTEDNYYGMLHSEAQMALVSKEDTDLDVAIQNMISGAVVDGAIELTGIRQRLTVLNNGHKLRDEQIPAGPASLAHAFDKAGKELTLEHESKLIIYLLFEKFVLRNTSKLYAQYNERLLKAGLLQNLKYQARKNPISKPSKQPQNSSKPQAEQNGQDQTNGTQGDSGSNQSLNYSAGQGTSGLPGSNSATGSGPGPGSGTESGSGQGSGSEGQNSSGNSSGGMTSDGSTSISDELFGNIMDLMARRNPNAGKRIKNAAPRAEIVSAIHTVQENLDITASIEMAADSSVGGKQSVEHMIQNLTAEREQLFRGIDRRRLPAADTQMIDLIGMMFEYMLNDKDIPNVAKAELSRLHTPYLKVAILDKTFFTNNDNTAHRLLNNLARAASHWVYEDNTERGIYPCIRKIVSRVLLEFKDNLCVFSEMNEVLNTNIKDLENKADRIEEQSRQAAEGKDKLDLARVSAENVLNEAVSRFNVPVEVRKMLDEVWKNKLTFIYLRNENTDSSDSWELATETIKSILWCTEPRYTAEEISALQEQHKDAHNRIKQSLESLSAYGSSNIDTDIALIRKYTDAAMAAGNPVHNVKDETDNTKSVTQVNTDNQQDSAANTTETVEASAPADNCSDDPANNEPSPKCIAAMKKLDKVQFGTWFTIIKDPDQTQLQAKLSWHSSISGNYMFVDSMGVKTAVLQRRDLADMLVSGNARIMTTEQRPLILRALRKIRRMLGTDEKVQA